LFSMYLTPKAVGNAELTLGGIDNSKFTGKSNSFQVPYPMVPLADSVSLIGAPVFASLPSGSGSTWQLVSPGISVNGKTTSTLKTSRTIIFDSGTSNVLFSTNTANVSVVQLKWPRYGTDFFLGVPGHLCTYLA